MSKKDQHFETAEKLYVYEHKTIEQIADLLPVAVRTLHYWKTEGLWDRKRCKYIETRKSFHEEIYDMAREMAESIRLELKSEEGVTPASYLNLKRIVEVIDKVKKYESSVKVDQKEDPASDINIDQILEAVRSKVMGL